VIGEMREMTFKDGPRVSPYLEAGAPTNCFLPGCRKAFDGAAIRGEDRRYYCSINCADTARKIDLSIVEELRPKVAAALASPHQKLTPSRVG
jgi:hypothetical protein